MNSKKFILKQVVSEKYDGMMLRNYLFDELKFSNRLVIKAKSTEGKILVNGEHRTVRYKLETSDILEIELPPEEKSEWIKAENIPLTILYEDEYLLIIDKEAGMPTLPSKLHPTGTLANGLAYYYQIKNIPYTIHVVTRLDKDTSGLVLIAKHQYSHSLLSSMQRENEINRTYRAIVHGSLLAKKGTIDAPIGRNPHSIIERMIRDDGKQAITHYKVTKEVDQHSEVEIELETGRTHQIRVHFSFLGHSLVGDELYGGKTGNIKRQALHCSEISFSHPFLKKFIRIISEVPKDMGNLIT